MFHPNVKKGSQVHRDHFNALRSNSWTDPDWEIIAVDSSLGLSNLRPDWVIANNKRKLAIIIDVTAKFNPGHYKKGMQYVYELRKRLKDPTWEVVYLEDYWLNATVH